MVQTPGAFSPVDLGVSQAIGNAFQCFDLSITAFGIAVTRPVFKVIQYRISPVLEDIIPPYKLTIIG